MIERRKVAVATFGRSDFSILRPLCELLNDDPSFDVGLLVGGAHFEEVSGRTIRDVEASGLPIWARVDSGESDRSPLGTVEAMSSQMAGFAHAVTHGSDTDAGSAVAPDLVLILGDRFEAVAAGLGMVPLGIPVGHISGGSITEGAIDDVFRHCLTKIAAIHFCDLPAFAQRIHRMGEATDRIFTTGALGLDAFAHCEIADFDHFVQQFGFDGLRPGFILATLHPETARLEVNATMANDFVSALAASGAQVVFTYPNADPGADAIVPAIEAMADDGGFIVKSFGADWYPAALHHAGMMVGNSSSAIIEAASWDLPVVDIGERQAGREHGPNVIHCDRDREAILEALRRAGSKDFAESARGGNIYGDGHGADRVVESLSEFDWTKFDLPKPFVDPDPTFTGKMLSIP